MHRGIYMSPRAISDAKVHPRCEPSVHRPGGSDFAKRNPYRTALPPDSQPLPGAEKTSHRRRSVAPAERRVLTKESEYGAFKLQQQMRVREALLRASISASTRSCETSSDGRPPPHEAVARGWNTSHRASSRAQDGSWWKLERVQACHPQRRPSQAMS